MGEFLAVIVALAYVFALGCLFRLVWLVLWPGTRPLKLRDGPHISKSSMIKDKWHCSGGGRVGVGNTPDEAHKDWEKQA